VTEPPPSAEAAPPPKPAPWLDKKTLALSTTTVLAVLGGVGSYLNSCTETRNLENELLRQQVEQAAIVSASSSSDESIFNYLAQVSESMDQLQEQVHENEMLLLDTSWRLTVIEYVLKEWIPREEHAEAVQGLGPRLPRDRGSTPVESLPPPPESPWPGLQVGRPGD